jgi:hypothetical protein
VPRKLSSDRVADELDALLVLERAEAEAGESGFAAHALCRLVAGEGLYGDRCAQLGLSQLISELATGAADLGSLSAASLQALDREIDAASPHCEFIGTALRAAVLFGALSYKALILARDHLPAEIDG